jgi:5-formyltetrahydrofolate cyclo-ligase
MNKKELRKKYKTLRNHLNVEAVEEKSMAIANLALQLPIWEYSFYHLFLRIEEHKEVNTEYLLHILNGKDKNTILSKSDFQNISLQHYLLTDTTVIRKNLWNIPEPVGGIEIPADKIEVVFVPLLAFDVKGNRVGYGKGFYDRFLKVCKKEVIKVGLSFFEAEKEVMETFPSDVGLDFCITPEKIYLF